MAPQFTQKNLRYLARLGRASLGRRRGYHCEMSFWSGRNAGGDLLWRVGRLFGVGGVELNCGGVRTLKGNMERVSFGRAQYKFRPGAARSRAKARLCGIGGAPAGQGGGGLRGGGRREGGGRDA